MRNIRVGEPRNFLCQHMSCEANFKANPYWHLQPRRPRGHTGGGQWVEGDSVGHALFLSRPQISALLLAGDISGFTKHGINRAIQRGIAPVAILDAIQNPVRIRPREDGSVQYIGSSATVVLNSNGQVITVWPK